MKLRHEKDVRPKMLTSKRNEKNTKQLKGFSLNDKVRVFGKVGFITGFTGTSGVYVKTIDGEYVTIPNKSINKSISMSRTFMPK